MRSALVRASVIAALLLGGCTAPSANPASTTAGTTPSQAPTAAVVRGLATGLDVPWDLAALPDESVLVTLRDRAEVVRIDNDGSRRAVAHLAEVAPAGEGGLLGIALSPTFVSDQLVFLY